MELLTDYHIATTGSSSSMSVPLLEGKGSTVHETLWRERGGVEV